MSKWIYEGNYGLSVRTLRVTPFNEVVLFEVLSRNGRQMGAVELTVRRARMLARELGHWADKRSDRWIRTQRDRKRARRSTQGGGME